MQARSLVRAIVFLVFVVIIATPFVYQPQGVYPYILGKQAFFEGGVKLIFFLWLALVLTDRRYLPWRSHDGQGSSKAQLWICSALALFIGAMAVSAAFGIDSFRSFWSTQERALGVVAFAHVAALVLVLISLAREMPWKRLFLSSLATSVLVCAIAWTQTRVGGLLLRAEVATGRPGATFGNPTFLAGYLLVHVFIGLYMLGVFMRDSRKEHRGALLWGALACAGAAVVVNVVTLFLTETRGDILGFGVGIIALLTALTVRPPGLQNKVLKKRSVYAGLLLVALALPVVFFLTKEAPVWGSIPGIARFRSALAGSETFTPRLSALRAAWSGFLERPLVGWGPENFNVVFNKYYDPRTLETNYLETRFDKPHNVLFEDLVTGGVLLFVARIALLAALLYCSWKHKDDLWGPAAVAALSAYIARSIFVFDTTGPLLGLVLVAGFAAGGSMAGVPSEAASHAKRRIPASVVGGAVVASLALIYALNISTVIASGEQFWGFGYFTNGRPVLAIKSFRSAIERWTPYRWNLERDYAAAITEAYFNNSGLVRPDDVRTAIKTMEKVRDEHPEDAFNHYMLVDLYNEASDIDPDTYLKNALREGAIALQQSPNRQEVYFSLAKTYTLMGDNKKALELLEAAITVAPAVPDGHFFYGLILYSDGEPERGYAEIEKALELGRKWKNFNEPRVVANFFANSGHLDEAIGLYKKALEMKPKDLEAKIKLGVAYFVKGDKDRAKQYILEVANDFDLNKSPSYNDLKPILQALKIALPAK